MTFPGGISGHSLRAQIRVTSARLAATGLCSPAEPGRLDLQAEWPETG
jgi:hypothetical protein